MLKVLAQNYSLLGDHATFRCWKKAGSKSLSFVHAGDAFFLIYSLLRVGHSLPVMEDLILLEEAMGRNYAHDGRITSITSYGRVFGGASFFTLFTLYASGINLTWQWQRSEEGIITEVSFKPPMENTFSSLSVLLGGCCNLSHLESVRG